MVTRIFLLVLFSFINISFSHNSVGRILFSPSAYRIEVFDYLEISCLSKNFTFDNPFTDVTVNGKFVFEDGTTTNISGFCDDQNGKIFKIRFMPFKSGNYSYTVSFITKEKEYTYKNTLVALPSDNKGLIKVDPQYPFHFIWSGSNKHYFWNGTTAYLFYGIKDTIDLYSGIDRLSELGINNMRTSLFAAVNDFKKMNEPQIEKNPWFTGKLSPWLDQTADSIINMKFDLTRFNVSYFQHIEKAILHARSKDMVMSIIFYLAGNQKEPFTSEDGGGELEKLYFHYVIARFSAFSNVIWDLSNEYRLIRSDTWAESLGTFVKQTDPYNHLTTVHGFPYFQFRASSWADIAYFQEWDNAGGYNFMTANRIFQENSGRIIPQVNAEYGYEDHYPGFTFDKICPPGRNADDRRRLAWRICMAGGYQTTGESAKNGTGERRSLYAGWINGMGAGNSQLLSGMKIMKDIFEQLEWWKLTPDNSIINHGGYCLQEPGKQYLLYVVWGYIKINLVPGSYHVKVLNAATGQVAIEENINTSVWEKNFNDYPNDYAVIISKTTQ